MPNISFLKSVARLVMECYEFYHILVNIVFILRFNKYAFFPVMALIFVTTYPTYWRIINK